MDIVVFSLVGVGAAVLWLMLAGTLALVAGRMIHERDEHDRPAVTRPTARVVAQH